jgi:hypothetical protein
MHRSLQGQEQGNTYVPSAIDAGTATKNPFLAFFVTADDGSIDGDLEVLWNESDSASDNKIPVHTSTAGKGRRSLLVSDTTGPELKRVSIGYVNENPYRELEIVFFAQANTPTFATGTVTVLTSASMTDGETFVLNDGINPALEFEFDSNSSVAAWDGDPNNNIPIAFTSPGDADTDIRDATVAAINQVLDADFFITASAGSGGVVNLTHDTGGAIGNITITTTGVPAFSVSGMSGGGGALEGTGGVDDEIDNLPFKSVGMSAGVACSNGQADNQVGIRAVLGVAPTLEGFSDRIYYHEGTNLTKYGSGDTLTSVGTDGYVVDDNADVTEEESVDDRTITTHANDTITAATDEVFLQNGDFTDDDVGRTINFATPTNNPGDHVIQSVITKQRAVLETNVTVDDSGAWTTTTVKDANLGAYAFDGDMSAEVSTGVVDLGRKYRSVNTTAAHILGRVWFTAPADQIVGIRIIGPSGTPKDNYPEDFTVEYLDAQAVGGPGSKGSLEPHNDAHWTAIDSPLTSQGTNIFDGAERGYEFLFTTPPPQADTFGIRLKTMKSVAGSLGSASSVEIAELLIFGKRGVITLTAGSNDLISVALDGTPSGPGTPGAVGSSFVDFNLGNVTTTGVVANEDMQQVADAINDQIRGYGIEALRTPLGFLWLRQTVAGDNCQLDLDSDDNTGNLSCNAELGFQAVDATQTQSAGTTQAVQKLPSQALTIIYRANISGDL